MAGYTYINPLTGLTLLDMIALRQYLLGMVKNVYLCSKRYGLDMKKKEYQQLLHSAQAGDAAAQCKVGNCYYFGDIVKEDHTIATQWYMKSAEQGYAEAQCNLADCYYSGDGVAQDLPLAAQWYLCAAEQGVAGAQFRMGDCYLQGEGVERNHTTATQWYKKAAEQGHLEAMCYLANCYADGIGVTQSEAEAVRYWSIASDEGHPYASFRLACAYRDGKGVAQDKQRAIALLYKAKENGLNGLNDLLRDLGEKVEDKVINIVLRKEYAYEIVRGEKVREYRVGSDFWARRFFNFDDADKTMATSIKWYDRVHFYPNNNKWFVDCTIQKIEYVIVDEAFVEKYKAEVDTPVGTPLFVIHLGRVIDTNLSE